MEKPKVEKIKRMGEAFWIFLNSSMYGGEWGNDIIIIPTFKTNKIIPGKLLTFPGPYEEDYLVNVVIKKKDNDYVIEFV